MSRNQQEHPAPAPAAAVGNTRPHPESRNDLLRRLNAMIEKDIHSCAGERTDFIRSSSLKKLWRKEDILVLVPGLSEKQVKLICDEMLSLLSFIICLPPDLSWFDNAKDYLFKSEMELKYRDEDMPIDLTGLEKNLHLDWKVKRRWTEQYIYYLNYKSIVFDDGIDKEQHIDADARLPYVKDLESHDGGYGTVRCYEMAPEYIELGAKGQRVVPKDPVIVAVKEFKTNADGESEARNMRTLKKSLASNRGISLHRAIIARRPPDSRYPQQHRRSAQERTIYIIFPMAEFGSLETLLCGGRGMRSHEYSLPQRFPIVSKSQAELAGHLLEQSEAIVQALRFLHEGFVVGRETMACAHMDLKPDNIIIFEGGKVGTWKICDFGISVVRKKPSAGVQDQQSGQGDVVSLGDYYSKSIETYPKRPASDFQPPEVRDTGSATSPAKVGRRIDIWSFGAILAEILAFCMDTDKGVPLFREQRRDRVFGYENGLFYSPDTTASNSNYLSPSTAEEPAVDLQLRPQVRQWLDNISTSFSSQGPWIAMWIECIQKTLVISFKMRPKAIVLLKLIRGILAQLPSDGEDDDSSSEGSDSAPSNGGSDPGRTTPPQTPTPRIGINMPVHAEEESIRDNGGNATQVSEIVPESDISEIGSNMPPWTDARVTEESSITTIAELGRSRTIGEGKYDSSESSKNLGLKSESVIAIAIDDPRIVYLTMKWVKVYRIKTFGGFEVSEEESIPQQENQECRRHIAIAGDFMVLWRKLDTIAKILIYTYDDSSWKHTGLHELPVKTFDWFRRIALTRHGRVALIDGASIWITSASNGQRIRKKLKLPDLLGAAKVIDVAFNATGQVLFAWADIGTVGVLCVYRLGQCPETPEFPESPEPDQGPDHYHPFEYLSDEARDTSLTRLYPLQNSDGCVISISGIRYHTSRSKVWSDAKSANLTRSMKNIAQYRGTATQRDQAVKTLKGVFVYDDCSLIGPRKGSLRLGGKLDHLMEFPLSFTEPFMIWNQGKVLRRIHDRGKISASGAVTQEDSIYVFICCEQGDIYVARYKKTPLPPVGMERP